MIYTNESNDSIENEKDDANNEVRLARQCQKELHENVTSQLSGICNWSFSHITLAAVNIVVNNVVQYSTV